MIIFDEIAWIGLPDSPPFSFFFVSNKSSLFLSDVFDRIIPSILYLKINSIILLISLFSISGDNFINKGFFILFFFFNSVNLFNNSVRGSFSCKSLKPSVLGEDILIVM